MIRSRNSASTSLTSSPGISWRNTGERKRQVAHVGFDRVGDPGILDLDRDLATVVGHRLGTPVRCSPRQPVRDRSAPALRSGSSPHSAARTLRICFQFTGAHAVAQRREYAPGRRLPDPRRDRGSRSSTGPARPSSRRPASCASWSTRASTVATIRSPRRRRRSSSVPRASRRSLTHRRRAPDCTRPSRTVLVVRARLGGRSSSRRTSWTSTQCRSTTSNRRPGFVEAHRAR